MRSIAPWREYEQAGGDPSPVLAISSRQTPQSTPRIFPIQSPQSERPHEIDEFLCGGDLLAANLFLEARFGK